MKNRIQLLMAAGGIAVVCGLLLGCSDATKASFSALGKKHRITLYGNNGAPIKSWISTGSISDVNGDGCYFEDQETGLLVTIRGTMIIEIVK